MIKSFCLVIKLLFNIVSFQDEKCFIWSILAAIYADSVTYSRERVSHYRQHEHELNMSGIEMPMKCTEQNMTKFEHQNDISVSVYGWEEGKTNDDDEEKPGFAYPLRVAKEVKPRHVDLLLISNDETQHYCWIKKFSALVSSQYSGYHGELAYCRFCLHGFRGVAAPGQHTRLEDAKRRRDEHQLECFRHGGQKTSFPKDPIVKFRDIKKQVEAPYVAYADFESILVPTDTKIGKNTTKYQEHVACSYAYLIVSRVPGVEFEPRMYVGEDAAEHFLTSLQRDLNDYIMPTIENDVEMIWDEEAKRCYDEATDCFICSKPLDRENETPARDHCHFTGVFRGAVHQACNFGYQVEKERYKVNN